MKIVISIFVCILSFFIRVMLSFIIGGIFLYFTINILSGFAIILGVIAGTIIIVSYLLLYMFWLIMCENIHFLKKYTFEL